jgi:hypothetical protein
MSGTFPTSPSFTTTNFKLNAPTQTSETFGGKIRRVGIGTSYYTFTAKFPPMTRAQAQPIIAFLAQQYGKLESFQIYLPIESYPLANYSYPSPYIPRVVSTTAAGQKSVQITSCFPDTTILQAGDYFRFSNHTKVYMCSSTCISNNLGNATLYFTGSLLTEVGSVTTLTVKQVPFTVMLAADVQEYEIGLGRMYNLEIDLREDF